MISEPATRPRLFTRDDGRDRIAVPFAKGILSALGAVGIMFAILMLLVIVATVVSLLKGRSLPTNPADPLMQSIELLSYLGAGWFAWWRLRGMRPGTFRRLTGDDVRTILFGVLALIVVRIATGLVLVATHQTKHVQNGFEHFDVSSKVPGLTALMVGLTVLTAVAVAPVVEEIFFRGLLFGALARPIGVLAGALVTGLLFGLVHFDLVLFPTLAALGFIGALAYARSGNLWTSVTLHALNNALGAAYLIATTIKPGH
ncbi:MAG TPA: CPBP family intramembrane glutamic endopeptidase [Candidatus Elarobacter sp.]|jgi:hypothetical protein|nr:CPBP family intramembrane glutamic endopeptidase [Candidatus Elarobacter sp.]